MINEIVWMADRDRNGVLDFREFMTLVRTHDLGVLYPKLNMMMRTAAYVVVPRGERTNVVKSGLEEYKCCPPPVLMPLLSLIEVTKNQVLLAHHSHLKSDLLLFICM